MTDKKADIIKIETSERDTKIAEISGLTAEQVAILKATVAKNTSDTELAYFLSVCKTVDLSPFNKEIWCYKDGRGNLLVFAGRDGFLAKAQRNPAFNGIRSAEIRENDEWEINVPAGDVHHKVTKLGAERGKIIGAYAMVFRKDGELTLEFAEFDTYNKPYSVWKSHPADMIKKVAETHALKKAFGISAIQSEYDFETKGNVAIPIMTEAVIDTDKLTENLKAENQNEDSKK